MPRSILLALALVPADAGAQQVFKCVSGKEVAYQSAPCAQGQATEKAWEHGVYEPPDEAYLQRVRQMQDAVRQRDAQSRGSARAPTPATAKRSQGRKNRSTIGQCGAAKAHRDREIYKLGPWRKMKDLRRWDGYVAEACKP